MGLTSVAINIMVRVEGQKLSVLRKKFRHTAQPRLRRGVRTGGSKMKHKLFAAMAIALLCIFGVEAIAIAVPDTTTGTLVAQRDGCRGEDKDPC